MMAQSQVHNDPNVQQPNLVASAYVESNPGQQVNMADVDMGGNGSDAGEHDGGGNVPLGGVVAPAAAPIAHGHAGMNANHGVGAEVAVAAPNFRPPPGLKSPEFDAKDQATVDPQLARSFLNRVEAFCRCTRRDLNDADGMRDLMICMMQGTSAPLWLDTFLAANPNPSWDDLKSAFIQRWAPEVRTRESEAMA